MTTKILARILPFGVFMAFVGLEEAFRFGTSRAWWELGERFFLFLYPLKITAAALTLLIFRRSYREIQRADGKNLKHLLPGLALGVIVFLVWIQMDGLFFRLSPQNGTGPDLLELPALRTAWIALRLGGAVLVVPIMEELFWRSFLVRYLIRNDFESVPIGTFTWFSCLATIVLFGLEHHLIAAGMMAGAAYNLLLYRTRSIFHCIVAHAVTNLALGIYVLQTGQWQFW